MKTALIEKTTQTYTLYTFFPINQDYTEKEIGNLGKKHLANLFENPPKEIAAVFERGIQSITYTRLRIDQDAHMAVLEYTITTRT